MNVSFYDIDQNITYTPNFAIEGKYQIDDNITLNISSSKLDLVTIMHILNEVAIVYKFDYDKNKDVKHLCSNLKYRDLFEIMSSRVVGELIAEFTTGIDFEVLAFDTPDNRTILIEVMNENLEYARGTLFKLPELADGAYYHYDGVLY